MSASLIRPGIAVAFVLAMLIGSQPATAQGAAREEPDPIESVLFPPELIMEHARAIPLNDEQRATITRHIEQLQSRAVRLQWQLKEQVQELRETLARPRVDQDRAIDQLNRVLETEKNIKQAHLEMLIRIKNVLRPDQQQRLEQLRNASASRQDHEPERDS